MTIPEAAKELDLSETRLRVLCNEGRLGTKVGRQWLITREELDEFKEMPRNPGRPKSKP